RIDSGRAPWSSSRSTRAVSTCVLPVPADADSAACTRGSAASACSSISGGKDLKRVLMRLPKRRSRPYKTGHERRQRRTGGKGTAGQAGQGQRRRRDWIGSNRRGAALCVQGEEETPLGSFAAVPFFQPHQLIIVAIRRVGRVQLGGEGFAAGEPF